MGVKVDLISHNIQKLVKEKYRPKNFTLPRDMTYLIALDVDKKLFAKIKDDALFVQKLRDKISKEYQKLLQQVINYTKFYDGRMLSEDRDKTMKQWQEDVKSAFVTAEKQMVAMSNREIDKWKKTRNDRTKYLVKSAVKVTVGSLAAATATVGTVVAVPAGGGGAVVAIWAAAKAYLNLVKQIVDLAKTLEQIDKRLSKMLYELVKDYKKATKMKVSSKELAKKLGTQLFSDWMPGAQRTISNCERDIAFYSGKLKGVEVKASNASKELNKMIDKQEEIGKIVNVKIAKQLQKVGYQSKKLPKIQKNLRTLEGKTADSFKSISQLHKDIEMYNHQEKVYKEVIKYLNGKKPAWVSKVETGMVLIDWGLGAGFTTFSSAEQILVLVDAISADMTSMLAEEVL